MKNLFAEDCAITKNYEDEKNCSQQVARIN